MAAIDTSTGKVNTAKEVKDTLYQISERLKYYFKNLSLEDNFDASMYLSLQQNSEKVSALEITEQGLQSDYIDLEQSVSSQIAMLEKGITLAVNKGDVTNQLNLEPEALTISGSRLIITGENLSLDANNNLTVKGDITATSGKIAGWSLSQYDNKPCLAGGTNAMIKCNTYNCLKDIYLNKLMVSGNPGSTNLSYCQLDVAGATIQMDNNTSWNKIFTLGWVYVDQDIRTGLLVGDTRAYTKTFHAEAGVYTKKGGSFTSDERKKEDIESIPDADADVALKEIVPVTFRWTSDERPDAGFIAQDIADIEDKLQLDYGLVNEDTKGYLTLNYTGVMILLLKKLNEQTGRIDELTA